MYFLSPIKQPNLPPFGNNQSLLRILFVLSVYKILSGGRECSSFMNLVKYRVVRFYENVPKI